MSFWDFSSVNETPPQETVVTQGGGDLAFPDGTWLTVSLDEAKWNSFNGGERHISLRGSILAPQEYDGVKISNRKVFAKLWIVDGNLESKKDTADAYKKKHQTLLMGIDAHTGKVLLKKAVKSGNQDWSPNDEDLVEIINKPFSWRIGAMKSKEGKIINYLSGIGAPNRAPEINGKLSYNERDETPRGSSMSSSSGGSRQDMDDEIPF
jgi:hypothetical protein